MRRALWRAQRRWCGKSKSARRAAGQRRPTTARAPAQRLPGLLTRFRLPPPLPLAQALRALLQRACLLLPPAPPLSPRPSVGGPASEAWPPPIRLPSALGSGSGGPPPPEELICALTRSLMTEPAVTERGTTFERSAMLAWLDSCAAAGRHPTDPLTGRRLRSARLTPNWALRHALERWAAEAEAPAARARRRGIARASSSAGGASGSGDGRPVAAA